MGLTARVFLVALGLGVPFLTPSAQAQTQTHHRQVGTTDATREAAREHYRRGRELYEAGNPGQALRELEVSYALAPHWVTLNGMALCLEDLGRPADALAAYQRALREGGGEIPTEQRRQIEERVHFLRTELGLGRLIVISTPPGATVLLDGVPVGTTPFDGDVRAGTHMLAVVMEGEGGGRAERAVTLASGETRTFELALVAPDPPPVPSVLRVESEPSGAAVFLDGVRLGVTPLRTTNVSAGEFELRVRGDRGQEWRERVTIAQGAELRVRVELPGEGVPQHWFWALSATAAALGLGGAVAGGWGMSLHDEYHDPNTSRRRRAEARDLGETLFDAADGMFITAGAAALGALILGLFTDFGGTEADATVDVAPLAEGTSH